ncbi:sushi, von Willebrand factor type A, EGF and pentraxin domain-containing protein 1-like isoform X3 [Heterodontus francisci]|uniref:sushi, von Willebrand factor type A, EGF and pentraxin domain-containing protein 1-like isoform X3 n=1 Tax=Heterodontus francisci TaxID=7792 RepID=UPI00355BF849
MKGPHMNGMATAFRGAKRTKLKMVEKLLLALMAIYTVWVARVAGDCGKPPILKNGSPTDRYISRTSFPVGGRVFYKCYPGYTFKEGGSRSITCKKDSTWSSLRAVCESRSCGNPGEILNGYYTVTDATFGQQVDFHCEQGYRLVGRAFRLCKAGGWDGQVPTCESIECDDLPPILNGRTPLPTYAENWEYGMVARYSCTGDYSLIGAEELLCTETGKWDKDPPTCKVVRCHRPKLIVNGQIVSGFGPTYKYQDAITYTCNKGYEMVGSSAIVCSENNTFVPPPPMCKPRTCDKPPHLEYGSSRYISQTSFRVGSKVFYRCNRGYVFKEGSSRSVICGYDSTWTPLQATCEPRNCGNPGEILDGYFEAPDNSLGSKVIFYCDKGYRLVGRDHRVCTADGWDGQVPTCKSVTCADLPLISKGIAPSPPDGDHWKHGMIAKYSCHNGNSLIGAEKLVCTENGEWDKDPPTCKVVRCIRPVSIAHGRIVAGFGPIYQYLETITFHCNDGYEMVGNSVIQCSENNKFVPPPPTCRPPVRCSDLPPIHNGRAPRPPYGGHWKYGMVAKYSCIGEYSLMGAAELVCTETGKWDKAPPTCEAMDCGNPEEILNGYYEAPNTKLGSKATFYCEEGYRMVGWNYQWCTSSGWDGQVPACEFAGCQSPELPPNGHIVAGFGPTYKYRETITYSCNAGYEMDGNSVIECSENNIFVPPPPICRPRSCGKVPQLENGSPTEELISQTSFGVGTEVTYSCYTGYTLKDGRSKFVTCQMDSTWTPLQAICEPMDCGNPEEILNGYYEAPNTKLGSKATFYCEEGYRMVGRNYQWCTSSGWDGQVPACEFAGCQSPELPPNGHIVAGFGPTYKYRETITYSCNAGYEMDGNSVIKCSENNIFVPPPPICRPRSCGKVPQLENGSPTEELISQTSFDVGTEVTYSCYTGYTLKDGRSKSVTCQMDSTWTPLQAICEPMDCGNPEEILNGYYEAPNTKLGSKATFYCEEGYRMVGRNYQWCTSSGWDGQVPACEFAGCQSPELPPNGHIVAGFGPTYKYRETITYSCNAGYEMDGNSVIKCSENNIFVPPPPICRPRSCGKVPQLENGSPTEELISQTSFDVGTEVTYSCYTGYTLKDGRSKSVTCQMDSTWTPLQAICEPMDCGNPEEILNGYYEVPNTKLGSKATFYCEEGYRMVGRNYQWCTSSGWDGQVPACEFAGCQSPELPPNGHIVAGFGPTYKYRETITYSCNAGYEMDGNSVIKCSENNIFVPPPPICRPRSCGKVPQLENGSPTEELISQTSFDVGTEVTYSCYTGYTLKDGRSKSVTCQMDSIWTPLQAICEPINCGYPGDIVNGYYKASNTTVGNRVTFYCHIGYNMVGRDYRECTAEGWDGQVPSCEPINCGHPGDIVNGYYKAQNTTVGNRVIFYCDIGYKMVGRDYRECTAEGWDGQVPSCEIINCGHPGDIVNGYYKAQNMTVGNKVTFHCDIGYNMVGKDYRECTAEGWDGQVPSCEPINCGHPGDIVNGYYKAQNTTVGNRVTFYCDIGYKMVGRDYRECTAEGWDGQVPSCEPINCDHPGDIVNGYYKAQNTTVGNRVIFYCDIGYKMVGKEYRECTAEGWDGQVPSCEPINCGHPGDIVNGYYKAQNTTVGNRVTFYCDIGYKMVGRDYRECTAEGWDGQVPSCEPINCGHPGDIVNGYYKAQNTTVGNRVIFYCDIGYKMVGKEYRECTAEGWDGQVPSCEPINCGHPGDIVNGYYKAPNMTVGSKVTFYCDIGYNMVGRDYRECTAEGWDGQVPSCEPINCGHPGDIVNGYYKAPNTTAGNKIIFYCDNGYKLVGRDYRECTTEGWDGQVPSCEPINCGHPGDIVNGYSQAPNATVGNRVTFYCDIGYNMVGRDYQECTAEGWDGQVPSCEPINCGHPGDIVNGYYKATNMTVGNKVTFYCDIGYNMIGRDYRECTAEGWDGQVPSCEPINCGHPGDIVNGYYQAPNSTAGNKIIFYCDIGYKMVGRNYRECTAEGWDGQVPSCEPINCGHPGDIVNGYYKAPNTTVGNKVTFYCDIGCKMVGRDYRECTAEGWDGQVPSCEPLNCGHPGEIVNGYYNAPNTTVGSKVTFYCDIGYKMVGRGYRQCTADGWDGPVPSCESINCGNPGDIVNGYYKARNTTAGNQVTFHCDTGYNIVGRAYRQCTTQGWDGPVPLCEPPRGHLRTAIGIILGIAVSLGLMFCATHYYRKQLANKRQYYVANNIAMSPQIVSYSDGSFDDSV